MQEASGHFHRRLPEPAPKFLHLPIILNYYFISHPLFFIPLSNTSGFSGQAGFCSATARLRFRDTFGPTLRLVCRPCRSRKLTDIIYTDVNLLPLGETVRNLPDEEPLIHILTHISGKTCQNGSRVVASDPQCESAQTAVPVPSGRELSLSVRDQEMVEVAGVEPAGGGASTPANKRGAELSAEALTHILTNFTDMDRQMLSQIVERWGDLSDELKRAVLAVLGSGL